MGYVILFYFSPAHNEPKMHLMFSPSVTLHNKKKWLHFLFFFRLGHKLKTNTAVIQLRKIDSDTDFSLVFESGWCLYIHQRVFLFFFYVALGRMGLLECGVFATGIHDGKRPVIASDGIVQLRTLIRNEVEQYRKPSQWLHSIETKQPR